MMRTSRYGRPILAADVDNLSNALSAFQAAMSAWIDAYGNDPASEQLADAGTDLSDVLTELLKYALAPSVHGLIIVK